jgi:anaerobic magnesium-protoporphyrin IX monomethyl ester cyclase
MRTDLMRGVSAAAGKSPGRTDCLILGYYESSFVDYVQRARAKGEHWGGGYRGLNLTFVDFEGQPYRSMDLLNRFYFEGRDGFRAPFHNTDFIWPTIFYLGTYLSRRGFTFDYVNAVHLNADLLREKLENDNILTVAITTTLYVWPQPIVELIAFIRYYNPRAKIVVGGPYMAAMSNLGEAAALQEELRAIGADFYVLSNEGEETLANLLRACTTGGGLDQVANLAYRRPDGSYAFTPSSEEYSALDENMVDYSLFPRDQIGQFVTIRTAKSCPFRCAFCSFPQRGGAYTYLPVELVEKELDALKEIGTVTTVTFIDDTLNVPKQRFRDILRLMIRKKYGFRWNSFYRCDQGDNDTIELMAEAGCEGVFLGVESGSDSILARMNKTSRRKHYAQAIPHLQKHGISVHANFIVGFPGEILETVRESVDLIRKPSPISTGRTCGTPAAIRRSGKRRTSSRSKARCSTGLTARWTTGRRRT